MKTKIEWAELHAPLFLAGTNLGLKLDPKKRSGLTLEYDEEKRHLYAGFNEKSARIPESSVLSMVEAGPVAVVPKHPFPTPPQAKPFEAQVETPLSHVHAGPGKGQTGQEEPKRGPGRPKVIL